MPICPLRWRGSLDLMYSHMTRGNFSTTEGTRAGLLRCLTLEPNTKLRHHRLRREWRWEPDVIVMYESSAGSGLALQNGSIHVFLNRGVAPSAMEAKK